MTEGNDAMFAGLVTGMVFITISAFSAGGRSRLQIRKLRETMASGIILSHAKAGETPTTRGLQDSDYHRHLLQRGLDHLLAALQVSDQALTGDTSHWLSHQARVHWWFGSVRLRQLMDWTQKAPAFLISLGLLGTFIGLSIALGDIDHILRSGLPPAQISSALANMLNPMGTAFRSSLFGLSFSLLIILNNQIRGWYTAIENLELDLSHFFDNQLIKLQQRDPTQGLSPVRKDMAGVVQGLDTFQKKIETTAESFGDRLIHTVDQAVERTMGARLDELHNQSLVMAEEARQAVERMGKMVNHLSEAGQDFIGAAAAFRDTDFATALHESVQGMFENQESLARTTESLCERMGLLRDSLTYTEMNWQTLAVAAEQELKSASMASAASREATSALVEASAQLSQGGDQLTDFATALHKSVQGMFENQESLARTTESLCERMGLLRDSLTHTQMDWQTLAVAAEQELKSASMASAASREATSALVEASAQLSQGGDQLMALQKELRTASEAVCSISGEAAELAKALTDTLVVDQAIGNSVVATCNILETAVQSWSASVERTDQLAANYVEGLQAATGNSLKDLEQQEQELRSSLNRSRDDLVQFVNGEVQQRLASFQQVDRHATQAASRLRRLSAGLEDLHSAVSEAIWRNNLEKVTAMEHTTVGDGS